MNVSPEDLVKAYRDVFTSQSGRVILADLVRHFSFTQRTIIGRDTHETYANIGARSVLVYIERVLTTDPNMELKQEPEYDGQDDIAGMDQGF